MIIALDTMYVNSRIDVKSFLYIRQSIILGFNILTGLKDSNIDLRTQGAQGETKGTADQYVVNKFNEQATSL